MFGRAEEGGRPTATFYVDLAEARAALAQLRDLNPSLELRIGITPLGTAFALSEGWNGDPGVTIRVAPPAACSELYADIARAVWFGRRCNHADRSGKALSLILTGSSSCAPLAPTSPAARSRFSSPWPCIVGRAGCLAPLHLPRQAPPARARSAPAGRRGSAAPSRNGPAWRPPRRAGPIPRILHVPQRLWLRPSVRLLPHGQRRAARTLTPPVGQ